MRLIVCKQWIKASRSFRKPKDGEIGCHPNFRDFSTNTIFFSNLQVKYEILSSWGLSNDVIQPLHYCFEVVGFRLWYHARPVGNFPLLFCVCKNEEQITLMKNYQSKYLRHRSEWILILTSFNWRACSGWIQIQISQNFIVSVHSSKRKNWKRTDGPWQSQLSFEPGPMDSFKSLFINGCQFIILLSLCKLAYQASLPCAKLKRILALRWGLVG